VLVYKFDARHSSFWNSRESETAECRQVSAVADKPRDVWVTSMVLSTKVDAQFAELEPAELQLMTDRFPVPVSGTGKPASENRYRFPTTLTIGGLTPWAHVGMGNGAVVSLEGSTCHRKAGKLRGSRLGLPFGPS